MKTSSFNQTKVGPGRISIARVPPRWWPKGFRVYRDLAPGPWWNSVEWDEYVRRYETQLSRLDPHQVWLDLHALTGGAEPILCCWEDLSDPEQRCHRTLIAEWLEKSLGVEIEELTTLQLVLF